MIPTGGQKPSETNARVMRLSVVNARRWRVPKTATVVATVAMRCTGEMCTCGSMDVNPYMSMLTYCTKDCIKRLYGRLATRRTTGNSRQGGRPSHVVRRAIDENDRCRWSHPQVNTAGCHRSFSPKTDGREELRGAPPGHSLSFQVHWLRVPVRSNWHPCEVVSTLCADPFGQLAGTFFRSQFSQPFLVYRFPRSPDDRV